MAQQTSTAYDRRINELRRRTRHRVRRRLLDRLAAQRLQYAKIVAVLDWVSAIFRECERLQSHGALPLAYARGLGPERTIKRYMDLALASTDKDGSPDFIVHGATLHIPHMRHSKEDMACAEARWSRARAFAKHRKARQRERERERQFAEACMATVPQTPPSEAICEVSRSEYSLQEYNLRQDTAGSELCDADELFAQAIARAEAADAAVAAGAAVGHECPRAKRAMTSLEATEAALAYERSLRDANRAEEDRQAELRPKRGGGAVPTQPRCDTTPSKLAAWGYDASRVRGYKFTESELNRAVEKVESAKRPIGNRAGAVVAAILRWRSGEWDQAAA